jgi:hypothetical protein
MVGRHRSRQETTKVVWRRTFCLFLSLMSCCVCVSAVSSPVSYLISLMIKSEIVFDAFIPRLFPPPLPFVTSRLRSSTEMCARLPCSWWEFVPPL